MKRPIFTFLIFFTSFSGMASVFAQSILSVNDATAPPYNNMVNLIRDQLTGSGIDILNVESNNDPRSIGYFTDGDSSIGLKRGLVMTSGFADEVANLGQFWANNGNTGGSILPELSAIATNEIKNIAYFRITFRPKSDSIRFRYVFGSEEYPEFSCTSFNDVFGFFLSGPKPGGGFYSDENIALIPGTSLPVAINNLHPANASQTLCVPFNDEFYHDNLGTQKQPVYDGFTDVFVAEASVIPCETYEMLLAIADLGDPAYDSGVFLEANSWQSPIEIASTLFTDQAILPEIATGDTLYFSAPDAPANLFPIQIKIAGTAINGLDYQAVDSIKTLFSTNDVASYVIQPIQDTLNEGLESVLFQVQGNSMNACVLQEYTLYIAGSDSLAGPTDTTIVQLFGSSTLLSVNPTNISNQTWTASNTIDQPIIPSGNLIQSEISIQTPFDLLHDLSLLESVCLNIEHLWDDDLDIYLIAPNLTFVELSTDNGSNGDHYTNTCFSPSAIKEIRGGFPFAPASAAPFTGTFLPEGEWNDIQGTPINGIWTLGVLDDQNNMSGKLLDWSITFSSKNLGHFQYLWNTGETTPEISVNTPGLYSVRVSNQVGSFTKQYKVLAGNVATQSPTLPQTVFHLLPNPSNGETVVILNENVKVSNLKVFDTSGTLVLEQKNTGVIRGAEILPKGMYWVVLECLEGVFTQKLIRL